MAELAAALVGGIIGLFVAALYGGGRSWSWAREAGEITRSAKLLAL